jgi:hypothetical protein
MLGSRIPIPPLVSLLDYQTKSMATRWLMFHFGDVNPSGCMLLAKVTLDMDHCSIQLSNLRTFRRTNTPRDCILTIDTPSYEISLLAVGLVTVFRIRSLCTGISVQPLQRLMLGHSVILTKRSTNCIRRPFMAMGGFVHSRGNHCLALSRISNFA